MVERKVADILQRMLCVCLASVKSWSRRGDGMDVERDLDAGRRC